MQVRQDKWRARTPRAAAIAALAALVSAGACAIGPIDASAHGHLRAAVTPPVFTDRVIFDGAQLEHAAPSGAEPLTQPDDITTLGGELFVIFQNKVGPQGEPSETGNLSSTVVELTPSGRPVNQWDVEGHADGLTADPETGQVIVTVNEDANSSLSTIDPASGEVVHYAYNEPLPSAGGTDAISIYHGTILISASAPGTTGLPAPQAAYPAVYEVQLEAATHTAVIAPLFGDEATATLANAGAEGASVMLELTDPDSNEVVPFYAARFAGDFMLDSQGDKEQVFVSNAGQADQSLSVLKLSNSVDDTAWPFEGGKLYATDGKHDTLVRIAGPFRAGSVMTATTPCDANGAPSECPGPGFPANYLGDLNPWTGEITPVELIGPEVQPKGLLFVP